MLFLAHCRWWFFDLLYFQLFIYIFFFPFADLSFSAGRRTTQSVSVHFPLVFQRCYWLLMLAVFPPRTCSAYGRDWWKMLLSVLLTSHETDLRARKLLPADFPSVSGLRFGVHCTWLSATQKATSPLLFTAACVQGSVQRAGMCVTMRTVSIWAVWLCQEISPFGRWGSCCVESELENVLYVFGKQTACKMDGKAFPPKACCQQDSE